MPEVKFQFEKGMLDQTPKSAIANSINEIQK